MIEAFIHFFKMGGYGVYIFSAYGCVLLFLLVLWINAWRYYTPISSLACSRLQKNEQHS